jgi:glucose/arabinose dehydrogenase
MSSRWIRLTALALLAAAPAAFAGPDTVPGVRVIPAWANVTFEKPLWVGGPADGTDMMYVAEQAGRIKRLPKWRGGPVVQPTVFLDISGKCAGVKGGQGGIAGVAFHPKFRENGRFFVSYLASNPNPAFKIVLAEFRAMNGVCDPASEKTILEIPKSKPSHNGGGIEFAPDGTLWMGTGDNQDEKAAVTTSQNSQSLLGKIIRIDVNSGSPYAIPAGNPWPKVPGVRPEIWSLGYRNPWRFSFDAQGNPWVASPGRKDREWLTKATVGGNGGWPFMDGSQLNPTVPIPPAFQSVRFIPPAFEYVRTGEDDTTAMIGGYFYRGDRVKSLQGQYVFGDFSRGKIYVITIQGDRGANMREVGDVPAVSSLGQDAQGELYFCAYEDGRVFTLAPQ